MKTLLGTVSKVGRTVVPSISSQNSFSDGVSLQAKLANSIMFKYLHSPVKEGANKNDDGPKKTVRNNVNVYHYSTKKSGDGPDKTKGGSALGEFKTAFGEKFTVEKLQGMGDLKDVNTFLQKGGYSKLMSAYSVYKLWDNPQNAQNFIARDKDGEIVGVANYIGGPQSSVAKVMTNIKQLHHVESDIDKACELNFLLNENYRDGAGMDARLILEAIKQAKQAGSESAYLMLDENELNLNLVKRLQAMGVDIREAIKIKPRQEGDPPEICYEVNLKKDLPK